MSVEFLVTSLIVIVSPGTGVALHVDGRTVAGLAHMLALSAVFMLLTFVVFVGFGLFAASIRSHVISRPRVLTWMRRTFAAAFVGLGIKLALADR